MATLHQEKIPASSSDERGCCRRIGDCIGTAALLGVVAFVVGFLTRPAVVEPGHLMGLERYLVIWLLLALFVLGVQALMDGLNGQDQEAG